MSSEGSSPTKHVIDPSDDEIDEPQNARGGDLSSVGFNAGPSRASAQQPTPQNEGFSAAQNTAPQTAQSANADEYNWARTSVSQQRYDEIVGLPTYTQRKAAWEVDGRFKCPVKACKARHPPPHKPHHELSKGEYKAQQQATGKRAREREEIAPNKRIAPDIDVTEGMLPVIGEMRQLIGRGQPLTTSWQDRQPGWTPRPGIPPRPCSYCYAMHWEVDCPHRLTPLGQQVAGTFTELARQFTAQIEARNAQQRQNNPRGRARGRGGRGNRGGQGGRGRGRGT